MEIQSEKGTLTSQQAFLEVADSNQAKRRWGIRLPLPTVEWTEAVSVTHQSIPKVSRV